MDATAHSARRPVSAYMVLVAGEWDRPDLVRAASPEEAVRAFCRDRRPGPGVHILVWSAQDYALPPESRPTPRILRVE